MLRALPVLIQEANASGDAGANKSGFDKGTADDVAYEVHDDK